MSARLNVLRLRRGRTVGIGLIAIMGFLVFGFVFLEPVASSLPVIAPPEETNPFEIPFVEEVIPDTVQEEVGQSTEEIEEIVKDVSTDQGLIQIDDFDGSTTPDPEPDNQIICVVPDLIQTPELQTPEPFQPVETPMPSIDITPEIESKPIIPFDIDTIQSSVVCVEQEQITSEDPVLVQIIDETKDTNADIILPDTGSDTIQIIAEVTKTDSLGFSTVSETSFDLFVQSFLVEQGTNRDFESGSLEIRIRAIASNPDFTITGSSNFDLLIGGNTIFTMQVPVTFSGISGEDGVIGQFGGTSGSFVFFFADHLDEFPTLGTTMLEMKLNNVDINLDSRENFGATVLDLFTMNIDTDPDQILITDEQGEVQRIYPKDTKIRYFNSGDRVRDDSKRCLSSWTMHGGTIELYDSENNLLIKNELRVIPCIVTGAFPADLLLFRNQEYRLVHTLDSNPETNFDIKFTTPKSQKIFNLGCYWSNSIGVGCTYPNADGSDVLRAPPLQ